MAITVDLAHHGTRAPRIGVDITPTMHSTSCTIEDTSSHNTMNEFAPGELKLTTLHTSALQELLPCCIRALFGMHGISLLLQFILSISVRISEGYCSSVSLADVGESLFLLVEA